MSQNKAKVFGVGLNKTGTVTLRECGKILGYKCFGYSKVLLKDYVLKKDFSKIKHKTSQFNFFSDWPWPLLFKDLDELYPKSKFILTTRINEQVWLESLKKHSLRICSKANCRKLVYGFDFPHGYEKEHIRFYNQHNEDVRLYFMNRPKDFIELCWEKGDDFKKLCSFLNCEIPNVIFPHKNKSSEFKK